MPGSCTCTGLSTCGCASCLGAPAVYACGCDDPGDQNTAAHLLTLDGQFCQRRLANPEETSFLQASVGPTGNVQIGFSDGPEVDLATFNVTASVAFGNLIGIPSNGVWSQFVFPATPLLFLQTNAAGELIAAPLPASTVPDPLTVTTLNATNGNITNLAVSGANPVFSALAVGTITQIIGLNASNQLVKGNSSSGIQAAMFYESPTSPSNLTPNFSVVAGDFFTIGNTLLDSGANLFTITNGTTLTNAVPGLYVLLWVGYTTITARANVNAGIWLVVNGIVVNQGNSVPDGLGYSSMPGGPYTGIEVRRLNGETVRLQQSTDASGNAHTYGVRLIAIKIGD